LICLQLSETMGIQLQLIKDGDGLTFPKIGQTVIVHYIGSLEDGTQFDSSRRSGKPFKFTVGSGDVIRGWDEGIVQVGLIKLYCYLQAKHH